LFRAALVIDYPSARRPAFDPAKQSRTAAVVRAACGPNWRVCWPRRNTPVFVTGQKPPINGLNLSINIVDATNPVDARNIQHIRNERMSLAIPLDALDPPRLTRPSSRSISFASTAH
jgi:hypothetical protein